MTGAELLVAAYLARLTASVTVDTSSARDSTGHARTFVKAGILEPAQRGYRLTAIGEQFAYQQHWTSFSGGYSIPVGTYRLLKITSDRVYGQNERVEYSYTVVPNENAKTLERLVPIGAWTVNAYPHECPTAIADFAKPAPSYAIIMSLRGVDTVTYPQSFPFGIVRGQHGCRKSK